MKPETGGSGFSCPDCAAPIDVSLTRRQQRCTACGLPLSGPLAGRLWIVDQTIAALRAERVELIRGLRDQGTSTQAAAEYRASIAVPVPVPVPVPVEGTGTGTAAPGTAAADSAASVTAPSAAFPPPPGTPSWPLPPQRPRQEWSRRRVQNLLLSLGVLLLAVSAIIFIAVNWGVLGVAGRAAVLGTVTLLTGAGAMLAHRRNLPATAEAVAALTVALLGVDAAGLRLTGFSAGAISASSYTAIAVATIALIATVWLRALPVRPLRFTASVGGQLVLPLAFASTIHDAHRPAAVAAAVMAFQAAALTALRGALRGRHLDPLVAGALRVGMYVAWVPAFVFAVGTCYIPDAFSAAGSVVLVVLVGTALGAAFIEKSPAGRDFLLAVATVTALTDAAAFVPHLPAEWRWPAVEGLALVFAVGLLPVPKKWRTGPEPVVLCAGVLAAVAASVPVVQAIAVPDVGLRNAWGRTWPAVRELKATAAVRDLHADAASARDWAGTPQTSLQVLGLMATLLVLAAGTRHAFVRFATVALVFLSLLLVPLETGMTVPFAIAWDLTLGSVLTLVSVRRLHGRPTPYEDLPGIVGATAGILFLLHGSVWSMQTPVLTVTSVGTLLAIAVATTVIGPSQRSYRLGTVTAASALFALEAVLIAWYQGISTAWTGVVLAAAAAALVIGGVLAGRRSAPVSRAPQAVGLMAGLTAIGLARSEPGAYSLVLGLLVAACATGILLGRDALEPVWGPLLQILACLEAAAFLHWSHPDIDDPHLALAAAAAAGVLTIAAPWLHRSDAPAAVAVPTRAAAPVAYLSALMAVLASGRAEVIWIALLIGGVAGTVATSLGHVRKQYPDEILRVAGGLSAFLLLASSWVRLAEAHVQSVEPYTVPAAVLLLVVGLLRRRRDREAASWPCYGPGLLLGLVPTLLQSMGEEGLLRPALVGAAALVAVLVGAARRLQAPLAVGGAVLAIDALAQLSPYLASVYNAVPRWALIAAAGALLLGLGVTYERRLRDLRTLTRKFTALR